MNLKEIRSSYPQYDILSDDELAKRMHAKFYSQLDFKDFSRRIGYMKGSNPGEYDPESKEWQEKYGATSGNSDLKNYVIGRGKGLSDLWLGAKQVVGLGSREEADEKKKTDAAIMKTKAGRAGAIESTITAALPSAFIPGANTVAGSALIGGGLSALQPVGEEDSRTKNVLVGGVLGGGSVLAARGLTSLYRGGKAMVEPLTNGGQERIAARTLEAFAGGREAAKKAADSIARNSADVLPGVKPTAAELADNAGLAQLERTLKNNPELLTAFSERASSNKNALMSVIDDIAGDSSRMSAAVNARSSAAKPLYDAARSATATADDDLAKLVARPSVQSAWSRAEKLASEGGEAISKDDLSGNTLHYLKMAMDDIADNPQAAGIGAHEARAVRSTRDQLLGWIEKNIPEYQAARTTYADMSKPINQMQIGSALRDKLQPALADFGANQRLRPQAFAQALREGDNLAARELGRSNAKLSDIMTAHQMKQLNSVGKQLGRRANADELGKAVGSNTGQNMVSQNIVRQFLGPLGMPESMLQRTAESTLMQSVLRPAQFVGKLGEERAIKKLAEAGLDPNVAKKLLEMGVSPQQIGLLKYQGLLPAVASGSNAAGQ